MGRSCAVQQCSSNDSKKDSPPLTFHRFPKDEVLRRRWEEALNRPDWKSNKYTVICSLHFDTFCFFKTNAGLVKLMPGSVPSIIPTITKPLTKTMDNFTFVGVKSDCMNEESETEADVGNPFEIVKEEGVTETEVMNPLEIVKEEGVTETEVMNPLEIMKVEGDEEALYNHHTGVNFIDIKCEPEAMTISNAEDEVDPLEEQAFVKQEVQETVGESCLTDYVIPEEEDIAEVKQEDEVIIDDGISVDGSDEEDTNYQCKYCDQTFSDAQEMEVHQWSHCNDAMHCCTLCSDKFCSAQFLMKHMVESHKEALVPTDYLTCEICQKKCRSASTLKSHTLFHKVERTIECRKCATKIDWVGSLQQFNMYKNREKTFLCRTCDQITMSQLIDLAISGNNKAVRKKIGRTMTIDPTPSTSKFSCDICSSIFSTYPLLLAHEMEHKVEKDLLCPSCGKVIRWGGTLGQCNKYLSGEEEFTCLSCAVDKVKECSICKTKVNRWSGILHENLIMVNNVPQTEQKFVCSQCNHSSSVVSSETILSTQMFKPILPKQLPSVNVDSPVSQTSTGSQTCENNICILCNANFKSFHKLHTHKEGHKIQSCVDCSKCRKVIKWYGSLANLEDYISGKKRIFCNDCVIKNMGKLKINTQGQYLHANVACSNCLTNVKWVGSLLQLQKYTTKFERLLCGRCENTVKAIQIQTLVNNKERMVQANVCCTSCKRVFLWSGRFGTLNKITTGTIDANLCPVCAMKVIQGKDAKKLKSLTCTVCKKTFSKMNKNYEIKCKSFEGVNCVEFKFNESVCDQCEQYLKKKDEENGKTLTCEMCRPNGKFTFTDLPSFLTHIKCHVPIKDFVCTACNKIGYWGNISDSVNSFYCKRCNTDNSEVRFNNLTKENIIFENKIVDNFKTTPMVEEELECSLCRKFYPWYGNEKQLNEITSGGKVYICLKCCTHGTTKVSNVKTYQNKRLKV